MSRGKQVLPVLKVRMGRMVNKVRLVPLVLPGQKATLVLVVRRV